MGGRATEAEGMGPAIVEGVAGLAAEWSPEERDVLRAVFHALARGRPATTTDIAQAAGHPIESVDAVMKRRGHAMERDDQGRIVGWSGLTLRPTRHEIRAGDVTLYTWCALDPYFVAPILGAALHVQSRDPVSDEIVEVTVHPDGAVDAPESAVATLVTRDKERLAADVIANFCNFVHHFPSKEVATRFTPSGMKPAIVDLDVMAATGQAIYERVWRP